MGWLKGWTSLSSRPRDLQEKPLNSLPLRQLVIWEEFYLFILMHSQVYLYTCNLSIQNRSWSQLCPFRASLPRSSSTLSHHSCLGQLPLPWKNYFSFFPDIASLICCNKKVWYGKQQHNKSKLYFGQECWITINTPLPSSKAHNTSTSPELL